MKTKTKKSRKGINGSHKAHAKDPATLDARRKDARVMLAAGKSTAAVRSLLKAKYGMALGQHALLAMRNELRSGEPRAAVPVSPVSAVFSGTSITVPATAQLAEELVAAKAPFTFDGSSIKVRVSTAAEG